MVFCCGAKNQRTCLSFVSDQSQKVMYSMITSTALFSARVGACGGNYTSPSGVIYSPDFPDKYGAGRVCYWTIQVTGSSAILFNFTFFDISDQTDMVELLDGYTNQVVARFDWRSPPRDLVNITGDFVILYFYSDRTNQAKGFALLYQGESSPDFLKCLTYCDVFLHYSFCAQPAFIHNTLQTK